MAYIRLEDKEILRKEYAGQAMVSNRIVFGQYTSSETVAIMAKADADALIAELEKE